MIRRYDNTGQLIGMDGNISECPHCGTDWFQAKENALGDDAPPLFESLISATDNESTRLSQLIWGVVCYECNAHWIQVNLLSGLYKNG